MKRSSRPQEEILLWIILPQASAVLSFRNPLFNLTQSLSLMEHLKDQNALSQADEGSVELPDKSLDQVAGGVYHQPAPDPSIQPMP